MSAPLSSTAPSVRQDRPARAVRWFVAGTLLVAAAYLVRTIHDDAHNTRVHLALAALFTGVSLGLAVLARLAWTRIPHPHLRLVATLLLAWHACFGPVLMASRVASRTSSNDDLVPKLWPHIVHAINSLE